MKPLSILVACAAVSIALLSPNINAAGAASSSAVQAFYAEGANCLYMVDSSPESNGAGEHSYTRASSMAIEELQATDPGLALHAALLVLRAGCDTALNEGSDQVRDAGARGLAGAVLLSKEK